MEKCKEHNVGTIVLGYNNDFQFKSNIGKKQNQNILTHSIQTIQTKTKKHNAKYTKINLIIQDRIIHKPKQLLRQRHTTRIPRKRGGG